MDKHLIEIGMLVVYMPIYLGNKIEVKNLGIVSSMNDKYIFVKYNGSETANATLAKDLYPLYNRPDLLERMGLDVKPINRICELYLEEKKLNKILTNGT